ncbi:MAG: hypothetical protein ABJM06_11390 [Gilvibacter sp.]
MNKAIALFYKIYQNPKYLALATCGFFLSGIIIGLVIEPFQDAKAQWLYSTGELFSYVLVFGSFGWSFLHPFIVYSETKKQWKKHLFWIFIGLIPVLYALISLIWIYISFE